MVLLQLFSGLVSILVILSKNRKEKFNFLKYKGGIRFVEKPYFENPLRIKERKKKAKTLTRQKEKEVKLPEFGFDKKKYYETAKK